MRYIFTDKYQIDSETETLSAVFPIRKELEIFKDHFPGFPVFPGALILETMAQHGLELLKKTDPYDKDTLPILARIDNAKFLKMVRPDCDLQIFIKKEFSAGSVFKLSAEVRVENELCASAFLTVTMHKMPDFC